ncbi:MAG: hypothetical protein Q8N63_01555 [Nanoarchaeota archaeon]|nr:hypothetical protein [Nanoarchaeota archaeon]
MKVRADLHTHLGKLKSSYDFNKIINKARENLGRGGILGVTCFDDNRYKSLANSNGYKRENLGNGFYVPDKDILVVKTQEVFSERGHLLAVGLPEDKNLKSRKLIDIISEADSLGAGLIAVHLFALGGLGKFLSKNPEYLKNFIGIEIHNGEAFYADKKARNFFDLIKEDYEIGGISNSDGHYLFEIGSSNSLLDKPAYNNTEELSRTLNTAIRSHKDYSEDIMHPSYLGAFLHTGSVARRRMLKKLGFNTKMAYR